MLLDARGRQLSKAPKPNQRVIRSRRPQWLGARAEPPRTNHTAAVAPEVWNPIITELNGRR